MELNCESSLKSIFGIGHLFMTDVKEKICEGEDGAAVHGRFNALVKASWIVRWRIEREQTATLIEKSE